METKVITQSIEKITPEMADAILARKAINRPLSTEAVQRYANAMKNGKWHVGPPLLFNGDGSHDVWAGLIDGQHRIAAVKRSGVTTEFAVIKGLDNKLFMHVDVGKARTARDVLSVLGIKNAGIVAIVTRMIKHVENGGEAFSDYTSLLPADIAERAADERIYGVANDLYGKYVEARRLLKNVGLAGYMLYQGRVAGNADMETFFEILAGRMIPSSLRDPAHLLRNRLTADALSKHKMTRRDRAGLSIKAWNARNAGQLLERLKFGKKEKFPALEV